MLDPVAGVEEPPAVDSFAARGVGVPHHDQLSPPRDALPGECPLRCDQGAIGLSEPQGPGESMQRLPSELGPEPVQKPRKSGTTEHAMEKPILQRAVDLIAMREHGGEAPEPPLDRRPDARSGKAELRWKVEVVIAWEHDEVEASQRVEHRLIRDERDPPGGPERVEDVAREHQRRRGTPRQETQEILLGDRVGPIAVHVADDGRIH